MNTLKIIGSIESTIIDAYTKKNQAKRKMLNEDYTGTKQKLIDYIFGKSDENPFEDINKDYETRIAELDKKIEIKAHEIKTSYLGKQKRGVAFVKKLPTK